MADRFVVTKGDVAGKAEVARLVKRLKSLNGLALASQRQIARIRYGSLRRCLPGAIPPGNSISRSEELVAARGTKSASDHHDHREREVMPTNGPHDPHVHTFAVRAAAPMSGQRWRLAQQPGAPTRIEKILRIKGLLNIIGAPGPVVLHGVQRVIHPPVRLEARPDGDTSSRIVFVVQGIDPRRSRSR